MHIAKRIYIISDECKYLNMFSTEMQMKLDPSLKATILSKYVKINFQNFLIFIYSIKTNKSLITINFIRLCAPM